MCLHSKLGYLFALGEDGWAWTQIMELHLAVYLNYGSLQMFKEVFPTHTLYFVGSSFAFFIFIIFCIRLRVNAIHSWLSSEQFPLLYTTHLLTSSNVLQRQRESEGDWWTPTVMQNLLFNLGPKMLLVAIVSVGYILNDKLPSQMAHLLLWKWKQSWKHPKQEVCFLENFMKSPG